MGEWYKCIRVIVELTNCRYIEGVVRGYRNGLLTQTNYTNLTQCETIDGILGSGLIEDVIY